MSRIVHLGVVHRRDPFDTQDRNAAGELVHLDALTRRLAGTPYVVRGSFTDSNETFPQHAHDAIHVTRTTECEVYDGHPDDDPEDRTRIRLSPDEVGDVAMVLSIMLPSDLRVVDYWLEDDAEEWGSDVHLHGPWALASIAGRRI
jgi:hypothetical protein